MEFTFLGQCGVLLTDGTLRVAIDPVLNEIRDAAGESCRHYPPVCTVEEMHADYILCTHDHIDHLAMETVFAAYAFHQKVKIVVPKGCVSCLLDAKIPEENVIGLLDGEEICLEEGKLRIRGIATAHPIHQTNECGEDLTLAYGLQFGGLHVVHLGDTYRTQRLVQALLALEPIDLFLPPINGRDEERERRGIIGNLSYQEAAELAVLLKVKRSMPLHFDMFKGNTEDPQKYVAALASLDEQAVCEIPQRGVPISIR